jgi:hypothetical protein
LRGLLCLLFDFVLFFNGQSLPKSDSRTSEGQEPDRVVSYRAQRCSRFHPEERRRESRRGGSLGSLLTASRVLVARARPSPLPAGRSLRETWPAATASAEVKRGEDPSRSPAPGEREAPVRESRGETPSLSRLDSIHQWRIVFHRGHCRDSRLHRANRRPTER